MQKQRILDGLVALRLSLPFKEVLAMAKKTGDKLKEQNITS